jgi:cytochrome P450
MGLALDPDVLQRGGRISAFFVAGYRRMGPIFRYLRYGVSYTVLAGPEANQFATQHGQEILRASDYRAEQNRELEIEKQLVSMDGPDHRRHRLLQQHGYSRAMLDNRYDKMVATIQTFIVRWQPGDILSVRDALPPIIAELLGVGVLNYALGDHFDDVTLFVRTVVIETVARTRPRTVLDTPEYKQAKARSLKLADKIIDFHRRTSPTRNGRPDLVDDLLAAVDREPDLMTPQELRIAVLGGYVGGLDTVAYTCAFMLYALLENPPTLARVRSEIDAVFEAGGLTAGTISKMRALHGAALETLRLYPLSGAIQATSGRAFEFGGYEVPEGENLIVATTVPHFLPEIYKNPLDFDIDRFVSPRNEHTRPGVFAPFGVGPHVCLGAGLAQVLIMLTVATLIRFLQFEKHPANYRLKIGMVPVPVPEDFSIAIRAHRFSDSTPPKKRRENKK